VNVRGDCPNFRGGVSVAGRTEVFRRENGTVPFRSTLLAIALLAALVGAAILLRGGGRLPDTPEETVSEFFDAAARGDGAAYLRLTTGRLRQTLERTRDELGPEAFAEDLKRNAADIKGLAVSPSDRAPLTGVALEVDIVFADRNEQQRMVLVEERGGWAIDRIENASTVKPSIPYGTPVFEEPPGDPNAEERGLGEMERPEDAPAAR